MNVRLITKVLHTLSLLSDEDYDLVLKLRALTEDERGLLMTVLEPQKPVTKKTGKKPSKKSERASGMEAQLKSRVSEQREAATKDGDEGFDMSRHCSKCAKLADNNIHHLESHPDYHLFIEYAPSESAVAGTGD